jgi:hypothetical protein
MHGENLKLVYSDFGLLCVIVYDAVSKGINEVLCVRLSSESLGAL